MCGARHFFRACQVFPIINGAGIATPILGTPIPVGSNLQTIAADRMSNIWVAGSTITGDAMGNNVYIIVKGAQTASTISLTLGSASLSLSGKPMLPDLGTLFQLRAFVSAEGFTPTFLVLRT